MAQAFHANKLIVFFLELISKDEVLSMPCLQGSVLPSSKKKKKKERTLHNNPAHNLWLPLARYPYSCAYSKMPKHSTAAFCSDTADRRRQSANTREMEGTIFKVQEKTFKARNTFKSFGIKDSPCGCQWDDETSSENWYLLIKVRRS